MSESQPVSPPSASLQESVRAELEETRRDFLALLASLSETDLQQKSVTSTWTIKELLVHIVFWLRQTPGVVRMVRTGWGIRRIPTSLFDWLNLWLTRLAAWRQTRQSILARYERAYQATLRLVEGIQPDEWNKGASLEGRSTGNIAPSRSSFAPIAPICRSMRRKSARALAAREEHAGYIWKSEKKDGMCGSPD